MGHEFDPGERDMTEAAEADYPWFGPGEAVKAPLDYPTGSELDEMAMEFDSFPVREGDHDEA